MMGNARSKNPKPTIKEYRCFIYLFTTLLNASQDTYTMQDLRLQGWMNNRKFQISKPDKNFTV